MEVLNVIKELNSRSLPTVQKRIEEFARRRYGIGKEELNEVLMQLTRNGILLKSEKNKIVHYRIMETDAEISKKEIDAKKENNYELLDVVNELHESMVYFREEIYEEIAKLRGEAKTKTHAHDLVEKLQKENKRLKEEVKEKQTVINRLMAKTETSTNKSKKPMKPSKKTDIPEKEEKSKKEYIEFVGDSMVNGLEERGFCKNHRVKIRKHPGATSTDILDHLKPVLRRKPTKIVVHAGTNDITNNINYLKNVKLMLKIANEESPSTKIAFSGLVARYDIERGDQLVADVNKRLKNFCLQNELDFISHENIEEEDLGKRKLHPNKKGLKKMVNNFLDYLS